MIDILLENSAQYAEKINIYNNGEIISYRAGSEPFININGGWQNMLNEAHEMPAFGVSLNNATRKAMVSGLWLEFDFNKTFEHNGMPFEKLLIKVEKENCGFNLIRYNYEHGYEGRCFYFDLLGKNMADLYNMIINL